MEVQKCSICQETFEGYGNNPFPFPEGRCCDDCDNRFVIPARMSHVAPNTPAIELLMRIAKLGKMLVRTSVRGKVYPIKPE